MCKRGWSSLLIGVALGFAVKGLADYWIETGSMDTPRIYHTATVLNKGKVLAVGGQSGWSVYLSSCELYDTTSGTWTPANSLGIQRALHTATLLLDGKVLVTGGKRGGSAFLYYCELYDPTLGIWTDVDSMSVSRARHTATLLTKGKVLVVGGYNGSYLSSCELYDTATASWSSVNDLNIERCDHTATLLQDGKVLVAGGKNQVGILYSCELFDPTSGMWDIIDSMSTARMEHRATLLTNGKVLVTGGRSGNNYFSSCELYDPATEAWDTTGSMNVARARHRAVLLENGKVLVIGGYDGFSSISSCELYDPVTGVWELTDTLNTPRRNFDAALLLNGRVLAVGGYDGSNYLASCELYTPSAPAAQVEVRVPNGGELWIGGLDYLVEWKCDNPSFVDHYTLFYTINSPGWVVVYDSMSSPHPYPNDYDSTWMITRPGADTILVFFDSLFTEFGYDYVIIYGSNGDSITSYTGVQSDFWTPYIPGDTVKIRLISDGTTNCYGFDIMRDSCYYAGMATWDTIAASVSPADTTYNWRVPRITSFACRVMVQALNSMDNVISGDISDANFTIFTPGTEETASKQVFTLLENYPNPFIWETVIEVVGAGFILPNANGFDKSKPYSQLKIYDLCGRIVRTIPITQSPNDSITKVIWDGTDANGKKVKAGIYFVKLGALTKKLCLIR